MYANKERRNYRYGQASTIRDLLLEIGSDAWRSNQTLRASFKRWPSLFLIHDLRIEVNVAYNLIG